MQYAADARFRDLYENKYKYYGYYGGRASGKSYNVADYAVISALASSETVLTVREFGNSLDDSSYRLYLDRIKTLGLSDYFTYSAKNIVCPANGSRFRFLGLARNTDKIRSYHDATLTIVEEAQNISEYVFRVLLESVVRTSKSRLVCVWNPIYPTDAVDFFFRNEHKPKDAVCHCINYTGNKYFKNTPLISQLERMREMDYNKYRHVWEGEYFSVKNARILTNVHYAGNNEIDTTGLEPVYGVDFGSTDPNAFIRAYQLDNQRLYIDLAFKKQCSLDELAQYIKANVAKPSAIVVCDNAWSQSIELLRKHHINAKPALKGVNSVLTGLDWLQNYTILLHPSAKFFMEEAENYTWKIDRHKVNLDGSPFLKQEPIDRYNHLIDALRYATESFRQAKAKFFMAEL